MAHSSRDSWVMEKAAVLMRIRLYLERNAHIGATGLAAALKFDFEVAAEMPGFVDNFQRYYRHYPAFAAVEP